MPTLHSVSVATNDSTSYEIEHGHDVANRLQGIARPGLLFVALSSCNGRRTESCNLPEFAMNARDFERHAHGLETGEQTPERRNHMQIHPPPPEAIHMKEMLVG